MLFTLRRPLAWFALLVLTLLLASSQVLSPATTVAATDLVAGEQAVVSNTGGDSISVRESASLDGEVLTRLYEGETVLILDGPIDPGDGTVWYQVETSSLTGFMAADYLSGSVSAAATNATTTSALNLRSGPGTSNSVLLVMPSGAEITVTGSDSNGFLPVTYLGTSGWASAQYIDTGDDGGGFDTEPSDTGPATTTSSLNLRSGPGTGYGVLLVMPSGAVVERLGETANGFLSVSYQGTEGWASATYLTAGDNGGDDGGTVIGSAITTTSLNLRSGPSTSNSILLVMPSGAAVDLLDDSSGGFQKVSYQGTVGWAFADYLDVDGDDGGGDPVGTAFTTTSLNLRSGPSTSNAILKVMPAGAEVGILGDPENGFYPVRFGSTDGWASGTYLSFDDDGGGGASNIAWPVSGGAWTIIQGYNGGTHQNRSATAQYYYSLDIARSDGNTAYQDIYAPVSGTVVWNDPNSGGILIDMGNGYGLAMFHCTFDASWQRGDSVTQGDYLGYISPPGGNGYAVVSHIDMTLWQTPNGGSSPRYSAPYTGNNAISGQSFPDTGVYNMHGGTVFYP